MSDSLLKDASGVITFTIKVDGAQLPGDYAVISFVIRRDLNRIGMANILLQDGGFRGLDEDFKVANSGTFDPGKKIEILVGYSSKETKVFEGIIVKQGIRLSDDNRCLTVECKEEAVKMISVRKNMIFTEKKDSDIISDLLRENSLTATVEATSVKHPEVVQYYSTDWDFLVTRADLNGLIVLCDGKKVEVKKPDIKASPVVEIVAGRELISIDAEIDPRTQFTKISGIAWDMANQKVVKSNSKTVDEVEIGMTAAKLSKAVANDEFHLQTPSNLPANLLEAWATGKLTRSRLSKVQGTVKFIGTAKVKPGCLITLGGLNDSFNGNAFVCGVEHVVEEGQWRTEAVLGIPFKSYAEEMPDIEAPSASGLLPGIKGLHIGIVKKIHEDKDGQHRIQITLPTLEKDNVGVWARLSGFYASNQAGAFFMPEIGDEVIVGFINEDPQQPIILGSVYSSKNAPPFTSEEKNKIKALVTKSKMQIMFDEEKKTITIQTPAENKVILDDDKGVITLSDKNKNIIEMSKDGISIDCAKDFVLKAKGKISLEAQQDIQQKATGNFKGEGMQIEFKGSTKFAAEGAMTEIKGSGQAVIKGGVVMIN
jgi:Rhs element Vgr protein